MDVAAFAKGYLALVQSQNMGLGITQGSDSVSPVVDIERYLGANNRQSVNGDATPLTASANYVLTVPQGFCWVVRAGSAEYITAAGEAFAGGGILVLPPERLSSFFVSREVELLVAAARNQFVLWEYPGLVLNPGTQIGMYCSAVTGAPVGRLRLYIEALKV